MTDDHAAGEQAAGEQAAADIGYAEALAELEAILDEIEDDSVDVDVLATRVRRAALLLRVCRGRIAAARVEVESIVAELDADDDRRPPG
jgi:exodeoxyribonuclease VII small subunit